MHPKAVLPTIAVPVDLTAYRDLVWGRITDCAFPFAYTEMGIAYHFVHRGESGEPIVELVLERIVKRGERNVRLVYATGQYTYRICDDPDDASRAAVPIFLREVLARDVMLRNKFFDEDDYAASAFHKDLFDEGLAEDETRPGRVYGMPMNGQFGIRAELVPIDFDAAARLTSFQVTIHIAREADKVLSTPLGYAVDLTAKAREDVRDRFEMYMYVLHQSLLRVDDIKRTPGRVGDRYVRACCAIGIDLNDENLIQECAAQSYAFI
jgi:hypothetical protein